MIANQRLGKLCNYFDHYEYIIYLEFKMAAFDGVNICFHIRNLGAYTVERVHKNPCISTRLASRVKDTHVHYLLCNNHSIQQQQQQQQ
jgi:hypothetical protein